MGAVVSSSHIVTATPSSSEEDSSHCAPAPAWGPSCGRQFSTNFSNVSPSHSMQLFRDCSSVGPPWGHKSCQQTCSSTGSSLPTGPQVLQETAPACGPPRNEGGDLLHHRPPWLHSTVCSPWSAPRATGEPLLWHLEHLLPSFCKAVSLT